MMNSQSQVMLLSSPPPQLIVSNNVGAGRLLGEAYLASGRFVGKKVNRLAHQMGYGPDAIQQRVLKYFENKEERSSRLSDIRNGKIDPAVNKNCLELTKYALPTETRATQLKAFKSIVHLITRFPGLRPLFLRCESFQADGISKTSIFQLWENPSNTFTDISEWNFFHEFAASCVSDEAKLADIVEGAELDHLGNIPIDTGEYSVIEQLLVASESSDKFEPRIAIRYLGGILELPSFWSQKPHANQRTVAKKLFGRVKQLVVDQDVECMSGLDETLNDIRADLQGVDIIATAFLDGAKSWHPKVRSYFLDVLMDDVRRFIEILLHPGAQHFLPKSHRAAAEWVPLFQVDYQQELTEITVPDDDSNADTYPDVPPDTRNTADQVEPRTRPSKEGAADKPVEPNADPSTVERARFVVPSAPPYTNKGYNPLLDRPRPGTMTEYLRNFHVSFVVDDSGSMATENRWSEPRDALVGITQHAWEEDSAEIDIRFLNSPVLYRGVKEILESHETQPNTAADASPAIETLTSIHEGWVLKKRRRRFQGYGRRYFTLHHSGILSYSFEPGGPVRDQISLPHAAISTSAGRKDIYVDSNTATFLMRCLSTEDFDGWMAAIRRFISAESTAPKTVKGAIMSIFDRTRPAGRTPTGSVLEKVLNEYIAKLDAAVNTPAYNNLRPVDIIVLTDGVPSDDPKRVLMDATARMKAAGHHPNYVGVHIVQIGNDAEATRALDDLSHSHAISDIVDVVPYSGVPTPRRLERIILGT